IQQTDNDTTMSSSFVPCQTLYHQENKGIAVLYLSANKPGKICVQYSNPNSPQPAGIRIFNAQNTSSNVSYFTVSQNNDIIPTGNSIVVYTITTDSHVGFYGISLFCGGIPFAVGNDTNLTIVKDDFP